MMRCSRNLLSFIAFLMLHHRPICTNLTNSIMFYYSFPPHGNCKRSSEEGKIGLFHKVKISFLSYVDLSVGVSDCFTVWGQLLARDVISWIIPINWPAALQHCSTAALQHYCEVTAVIHTPDSTQSRGSLAVKIILHKTGCQGIPGRMWNLSKNE